MEQKNQKIRATVRIITVKTIVDDSPDLSFLETTAESHYGLNGANWAHVSEADKEKVIAEYGSIFKTCEAYAQRDKERLDRYGETWYMVGIVAKAEIRIPIGQNSFKIDYITSGGLGGIESDSDKAYLEEIKKEQINEVKQYLKVLCVKGINKAEIIEGD